MRTLENVDCDQGKRKMPTKLTRFSYLITWKCVCVLIYFLCFEVKDFCYLKIFNFSLHLEIKTWKSLACYLHWDYLHYRTTAYVLVDAEVRAPSVQVNLVSKRMSAIREVELTFEVTGKCHFLGTDYFNFDI